MAAKLRQRATDNKQLIGMALIFGLVLAGLLIYKLGSLTGGLSLGEVIAAKMPVGWHGIYHDPFYLPLKLLRSIDFFAFPEHGRTLTRLPNAVLGAVTILSFAGLVRLWHGRRTALLASAMFASSAWVLHASRLASFDVVYLSALPLLLFSHFLLRRYYQQPLTWFFNVCVWGVLLYVPGMIWLVAADMISQRKLLLTTWSHVQRWWQRLFYVLAWLIWLPLLVRYLSLDSHWRTWLGLPAHFAHVTHIIKQFIGVPVHLFARGPQYPDMWLGRLPILDIFTLVICFLGIYFYATHWKASRSRYLTIMAFIGFVLVGLGGPVGLSLLVPLLYMSAATGLAYLTLEWLKTFPNNPLARGLGIGLVIFAVALSCLYNLRSYFIAWPHATLTKATFQYHRRP